MKKILALILTMALIFSLTAALAEDNSLNATVNVSQDENVIPSVHSVNYAWTTPGPIEIKYRDVYTWSTTEHRYTLKKVFEGVVEYTFTIKITNDGNVPETFELTFEKGANVTASDNFERITVDTLAIDSGNITEDNYTSNREGATNEVSREFTIRITKIDFDIDQTAASNFSLGTVRITRV